MLTQASIFTEQWNGIENAPLLNQVADAAILFGIASGLKMAEDKTGLVMFKVLWWLFGSFGLYVVYIALFT